MAILIESPTGNVLVDEVSGRVLDEQALRSMARQVAYAANLDADIFEAQMLATTGFDPAQMSTADGIDPQGFFAAAAAGGQYGSPRTDGGGVGSPRDLNGNVISAGGPIQDGDPLSGAQGVPANSPKSDTGVGLLPGGYTTAEERALDMAYKQAQLNKLLSGDTGASGISAGVSRQNTIDSLAQEARQFKETYDFNKAKFDQAATADAAAIAAKRVQDDANRAQDASQFAAQQDLSRGNTLLGLGSRPDTLIKYLYAIRGQQTPQAIAGTTTSLPGYQNIVGQPNPGATIAPPSISAAGAGGATSSLPVPAASSPSMVSGAGMLAPQAAPNYAAGTQDLAAQNPALAQLLQSAQPAARPPSINLAPANLAPSIAPQPNYAAGTQQAAATNPALAQLLSSYAQNGYAEGGLIPERVVGVGTESGQSYEFGEKGTEAVVSNDMLERLMAVAGKVDIQEKGADGKSRRFNFTLNGAPKKKAPAIKADNSYASGGQIGYDPVGLGSQASGFFNDPNLRSVVDRGYNSSPQTPLLPQIGIATGGGQSLIPSMQRLNSLLPSEQSLYAGALQDEFGAQPDDVFSLAKKLAPGATNLSTPRFAN